LQRDILGPVDHAHAAGAKPVEEPVLARDADARREAVARRADDRVTDPSPDPAGASGAPQSPQ